MPRRLAVLNSRVFFVFLNFRTGGHHLWHFIAAARGNEGQGPLPSIVPSHVTYYIIIFGAWVYRTIDLSFFFISHGAPSSDAAFFVGHTVSRTRITSGAEDYLILVVRMMSNTIT